MQFLFRLGTAVLALLLTLAILIAGIAAAGYYYLEPGLPGATPLIELGGLMPERHYRTDSSEQPFVRSDVNGRASLRLSLNQRTHLRFEPVV